jgi:hypothetical protein
VSWADKAACAGDDTDAWFTVDPERVRHNKAVCAGCTVRLDCATFALATRTEAGIFAGFDLSSHRQRKNLRRWVDEQRPTAVVIPIRGRRELSTHPKAIDARQRRSATVDEMRRLAAGEAWA